MCCILGRDKLLTLTEPLSIQESNVHRRIIKEKEHKIENMCEDESTAVEKHLIPGNNSYF